MFILKQTNILKFGLISLVMIAILFLSYVIVGFIGIQNIMEPYPYGTFFTWIIILLSVFYRFTFLVLTFGVFLGLINVYEWHWIFALLFTLPGFLFMFPKKIRNFRMKSNSKNKNSEATSNFSKSSFQSKPKNNDIIEGDYEIIKDNKNKEK